MSSPQSFPLLVTGASGQLGRRVIAHLLDSEQVPPQQLIATTRKPSALADLAARGVQVRAADFDAADSLAAAFAGAQRLLLISTDALDHPGQRLRQHRAAIAAAVAAGVKHVVYTSMPKPETAAVLFAPDHVGTEQALAASPLDWTVLRDNWYFENLLFQAPAYLASGSWFSAAGGGRIAHIARDDVARAAAATLVGASGKRIYTLTGAQAFTTEEIAALLAKAAAAPIEVVPVDDATLTRSLIEAGLPAAFAAVLTSFDTNTRQGGVAEVTDDFRRLTGRTPQAFADWLDDHRAALTAPG